MKFRIVWAPVGYVISETYEVNCMINGCQVRSYGVMIHWAVEVADAANAQGVR